MTRTQNLSGALLLALAGTACGSSAPPPRRAPPPPPPAASTAEETTPEAQTNIYVYTPIGKRDPFQNVFAVQEVTPVKVPGVKPTPLQRWSVDQLKLSMTMTGTSSPMAVIEDPEGRGWTVRIGTFVGKNWGKVTAVQRDQVIITETITDHATGRVYPNNIPLKLPQEKGEAEAEQMLREGDSMGPSAQNAGR